MHCHVWESMLSLLITPLPVIDFAELAAAQKDDPEIKQFQIPDSSSSLKALALPTFEGTILCDMSTGQPRPYVPSRFQRSISIHFTLFHIQE